MANRENNSKENKESGSIPSLQNPGEHPSTYVVQDRSSESELIRLDEQDRMFTEFMGGVLSEQSDPNRFQRVLDVGCGPGWWLIETARAYPHMTQLVGVDVSGLIIEYARARAAEAGVSDRVHFQTGDALRMLEFRDNTFDLVNHRFALGWLRRWDWPKLLDEYQRVCQPEGVIRITEPVYPIPTNSPAYNHLFGLLLQALANAGHLLSPDPNGIIKALPKLMQKYGIGEIQTKVYTMELRDNSQAKQAYVVDCHRTFKNTVPYLRKWTRFPDNYDDLYQQMVRETQQLDFEVTQVLLTAWGIPMKTHRRFEGA